MVVRCTAQSKRNQRQCMSPATKLSLERERPLCRTHGGATKKNKTRHLVGAAIKGGPQTDPKTDTSKDTMAMASNKYVPRDIAERIARLQSDPRLMDVTSQAALIKGVQEHILERVNEGEDVEVAELTATVTQLAKLAETYSAIQKNNSEMMEPERYIAGFRQLVLQAQKAFAIFRGGASRVIMDNVKDEALRTLLLEGLDDEHDQALRDLAQMVKQVGERQGLPAASP